MDLAKTTQKINKQILRNSDIAARELRANYIKGLDAIRTMLRRLYDKYAIGGELTYAEMSKYNRLRGLEENIVEILRPMLNKNIRVIDKAAAVSYNEAYYKHTWAISQAVEANIAFAVIPKDAVMEAIKNPLEKIAKERLKADGRRKVRSAITQGLIRGESYSGMSKIVKGAINGSFADAERIVRTEAGRASTLGMLKSYDNAREEGVELGDVWDATLDSRTRPAHAELDGQRAEMIDGEFKFYSSDVGWIRGPHLSGVPSFDINCRCALRPVIDGYEPTERRIRDEGIQPYQTFKTWAEKSGVKANEYGQKYDFTKG